MTRYALICALFFGFFLTVTLGCSSRKGDEIVDSASSDIPAVADMTREALDWADSLTREMSLDEQLAQLMMPAVFANADPSSIHHVKWYAEDLKVGGLLLLKGSAQSAAVIADTLEAIRDRLPHSPGSFLAIDAETGLGMRFSDAPLFPWNSEIDRNASDSLFFEYGREVGREARLTGINMILGPVVDVDRSEGIGRGVMRKRSLGADQLRVANLSIAYARGLECMGVASVIKHFPGHGPTATDSHKRLPRISVSRDELYAVDLVPFQAAVANGLSSVMVGHLWVESLDTVERPASFSPVIINDILRKEIGFKGLVIVDAIEMAGAGGHTAADAIKAGADIILAPADTEKELAALKQAVEQGILPKSRVEESCRRILFFKYLRFINSDRRSDTSSPLNQLKERLFEEAPDIINSLKGL